MALRPYGYTVHSSDLYYRGYGDKRCVDFLTTTKPPTRLISAIVTNPPYNQALEFVQHALTFGVDVCMFLKLTFLEGQRRRKFFDEHPPRTVAVFSKRITVARNGNPEAFNQSSAACYAWFIWTPGYEGKPEVVWI
jgi:hypothetical protein